VIEVAVADPDNDTLLFPLYDAATALVPTSDGVTTATATVPSGPSAPTSPTGATTPAGGSITPLAGAPLPTAPTFSVAPPMSGVGFTRFAGGTVADLEAAAFAAGARSVYITSEGRFIGWIIGAPYWVNGEFAALFEHGIPGGQVVLLVVS
jgi:hypothetical protein